MKHSVFIYDSRRPRPRSIDDDIRLYSRLENSAALLISLILGGVLAYLISGAWWWK